MFDYEGMGERVATLRSRIRSMQRDDLGGEFPTRPELAALLPGGALRAGAVYAVSPSNSLLMLLLSGPSQAGSWCSVVGMPGFALEAAAGYGIDLTRLALIPSPGTRWMQVTATLADTMPVVAVRTPGAVSPGEAARLSARLRRRGSMLIAVGRWPAATASLSLTTTEWVGLGRGQGHITRRDAVLSVRRPDGRVSHRDLHLPPTASGTPGVSLPSHDAASRPADEQGAGLRAVV
jgi:hypothetical protein